MIFSENMKVNLRIEEERDRRASEYVTREAFWNVYNPGCCEHYVLHRFRKDPDFVPELTYVAEIGSKIVGHIMYSRGKIQKDGGGAIETAVFGPVSVLPEYQGTGIGGALIELTMEKAARMGFKIVTITGNPQYYSRFGFVSGAQKGIRYAGAPEGEDFPYFLVKELENGALEGVSGCFEDPPGYITDPEEVDRFDKCFPPKQKLRLPGQLGYQQEADYE